MNWTLLLLRPSSKTTITQHTHTHTHTLKMPTFQDSAPGAKSSKFNLLDPFAPFLAPHGNDEPDDSYNIPEITTENVDERLRRTMRGGGGGGEESIPSSQQGMQYPEEQQEQQQQPDNKVHPSEKTDMKFNNNNHYKNHIQKKRGDEDDDNEFDNDSDDDDDYDDLLDDDPAVEAFRNRRLAELKKTQIKHAENMAKGHGEYRIITQDEFLPECTGSDFVAVHFFHNDFERCKIMDHHLTIIAKRHTTCKFLRINAEKAPFFVTKLAIQTLPTLVLFQDGKTVERLTGFEGLSTNPRKPDEFRTSQLQIWLASTGAIQYNPNDESDDDTDDEEDGVSSRFQRLGVTHAAQSRYHRYDEDI